MKRRANKGFSLVETLVVLTIMLILMALYLPTLSKAMRKAKEVAGKEALHQQAIGKFADGANATRPGKATPKTREQARDAFRQTLDIGKGDNMLISEMLYIVTSDAEFRAYYHTLLNPANTAPLEFDSDGSLKAYDEADNQFSLQSAELIDSFKGTYAMAWEFLSTVPTETTSGSLGGSILYSDGHVGYLRYQQEFPMTRTVAELSHEFMESIS